LAFNNEVVSLIVSLNAVSLYENLSVELKDGNLFINGKKQSVNILDKYKAFLGDKKEINFSIKVDKK
jgi:hypothetical protein